MSSEGMDECQFGTTMVPAVKEEPSDKGQGDENIISHTELMDEIKTKLTDLIKADSLLNDLPGEVTLEEVNSQVALEHGQAMAVYIRREDGEVFPVVVTQNATVLDLKHALKRFIHLKLKREGSPRNISWRYVWKRYWLYYDGETLSENDKRLKDYGIHNKVEVSFRKRLVKK